MKEETKLYFDIKQLNNLSTGVKLATELKSSNDNLRKFLTVLGYSYNNGKIIMLDKYINNKSLNNIFFELRCYEISVDYLNYNWDITEENLESEIYLDDIKGVESLEKELLNYIKDFSVLLPEWNCENPL